MKAGRKLTCVDCHFLQEEGQFGQVGGTKPPHFFLRERDAIRDGVIDRAGTRRFSCWFGVWDERTNPYSVPSPFRHHRLVEKDRKGFCFFWPCRPGMEFGAAERLQKRQEDRRQTRWERWLAIGGLWVAAIALVLNVLVVLLKA